ncbi:MAG: hypothetical protein ACM37W_25175 [Actinomycetota bacterium]
MSDEVITLTVQYINGTIQCFEILSKTDKTEQANLATRIHKLVSADKIMLELRDELLVIPMTNVKNFSISPLPSKLPDGIIHNARLIEA